MSNLKTVGTLLAMAGAGMSYMAGSSSGSTAAVLGTLGAGLTAAGAYLIAKSPAAVPPIPPILPEAPAEKK